MIFGRKIKLIILTNIKTEDIILIEKGKTSNGYAKTNIIIKITLLALVGWRYFFMVNAKSNKIIIKDIM